MLVLVLNVWASTSSYKTCLLGSHGVVSSWCGSRSVLWSSVLGHLHAVLVWVHLRGSWRGNVARRIIVTVVHGWWFSICAVGSLAIRLSSVESEMVLRHLPILSSLVVWDKPLSKLLVKWIMEH